MGYLLLLINVAIYGVGTVLKKKFSEDTKSIPAALDVYMFFIFPIALLFYFVMAKGDVPLNLPTFLFALVFAVISLCATWFGMAAYRYTDLVYITVFNGAGGTVIPFLFELIFLQESFGVWKILSILLRIAAICVPLVWKRKEEKRTTKSGMIVCCILFLISGAAGVISKMYGLHPNVFSDNSFCFWTNVFILPFALAKVLRKTGIRTILKESRKIKGIDYLCVVISMLLSNAGTLLMLQALRLISATVYSVLNSSLTMLVTALLSMLWYKEKLTGESMLSILFSVLAIICGVF